MTQKVLHAFFNGAQNIPEKYSPVIKAFSNLNMLIVEKHPGDLPLYQVEAATAFRQFDFEGFDQSLIDLFNNLIPFVQIQDPSIIQRYEIDRAFKDDLIIIKGAVVQFLVTTKTTVKAAIDQHRLKQRHDIFSRK